MDRTVSGITVGRLAAAVLAQFGDSRPELHVDPQWGVVEVTTPSHPDGVVVAAAVTGAPSSCAVVRYAHHRARGLGLPLRVAHTWSRRTPEMTDLLLTSILYDCLSPSDAAAAEREILHDRDVGRALRALSNEARLLVVSSVTDSAGGRILGDTVVSLIGHTACPLAIVLASHAGHQPQWWTAPGGTGGRP
jgi:hypothetical protein